MNPQTQNTDKSRPELPCPEPLYEAVEEGIFHRCLDGTLKPTPAEVHLITHEHANEMISIACDIIELTRYEKAGARPNTGRAGRTDATREKNRKEIAKQINQLKLRKLGGMEAYSIAFGHEAMEELMRYVEYIAAEIMSDAKLPDIQLDLF